MKHIASFTLAILSICYTSFAQMADNQAFEGWKSDKYSMFIHFGLYSRLGGVWEGEPVRQGYSEQIQSFAGIFSDWYAETAYGFEPDGFDADEIALLAKESGMRSIVFTSKHHDGFCMYDTQTTGYNSMDMLPEGRDFVRELSEACARHGLKFGLYYSLIDWHYPHAYPISSHNADFITKEHHEYSKSQVRELLVSYGPVSELWFDMGSLEPWQSRELYDLVKSLQPDCMVSGRLGNDVYDFAVMADNRLPQTALHAPWQSAASMFPETWSYRSWQERGEVGDKVAEKLRTLIDVVSRGGNYLLNIGPDSEGNVVPFEKEVLLGVGDWLKRNGRAIYGTGASPFADEFGWGDVTIDGGTMYLLLTGRCPEDCLVRLPMKGFRLREAEGARAKMKGGECLVEVSEALYADPEDVKVVALTFDRPLTGLVRNEILPQTDMLSRSNATPEYSYSCFDYYSNYRSTVSYRWDVDVTVPVDEFEFFFTEDEIGRKVVMEIDEMRIPVEIYPEDLFESSGRITLSGHRFSCLRGGIFDGSASWESLDVKTLPESEPYVDMSVMPFSNYLMAADLEAVQDGLHVIEVTAGNGVEVVLDSKVVTKHLNPYRTVRKKEKVLLDLSAGRHEIMVRSYNRFEEELSCGISLPESPRIYSMKVRLPSKMKTGKHRMTLRAADRTSEHSDCALHNMYIRL